MNQLLMQTRPRVGTFVDATKSHSALDDATFDSVKIGRTIRQRGRADAALIRHLEADPCVISFEPFDEHDAPHEILEVITDVPAYSLLHVAGPFVIALNPSENCAASEALSVLDVHLAQQGRWLYQRDTPWLFAGHRWRNVEAIVASRFEPVLYGERLQLLSELDRVGELELLDCANMLSSARPIEAVLSLATRSDIFFDLAAPLSLSTLVRPTPSSRVL